MDRQALQIVWLKRDLRVQDHAALAAAAGTGLPVLLLYVFEPSMMRLPDYAARHARFAWQSLQQLRSHLPAGIGLLILHDEVVNALAQVMEQYTIAGIHSHQETGNAQSYERDKQVAQWCRWHGIPWTEHHDRGIVRGLRHRQNWPAQWYAMMHEPLVQLNISKIRWAEMPAWQNEVKDFGDLGMFDSDVAASMQPGGTAAGRRYLDSFLAERGVNYQRHISKPLLSRTGCSRLSPYLAYGCLSLRQVYQATLQRMDEAPVMKRPLKAFLDRLRWHSHFIQKLETRPALEWEDTNPAFSAIRQEVDEKRLEAWMKGNTGIPMIDASMRCLQQTGYLNFRMRAMLVSFLTHHLWQPWQAGAHHMAQLFLDYEPGIHYPQFQMQAGVTGINTIRIYNPVKQGLDHDANGAFVKRWLPQLQYVPAPLVHKPWELTVMEQVQYGCGIGTDYPRPIVDVDEAARHAREQLWRIKATKMVKQYNAGILQQLSGRSREDEEGA